MIEHLQRLVALDTQNPPRTITAEHPILRHCAAVLEGAGCNVTLDDLGDGCVILLAQRGNPSVLVNCHLDTVPAAPGWQHDPLSLRLHEGRAYGLGACDIKGAAACLLAAAGVTNGELAILLTTDEEAGASQCVRSFLARPHSFQQVLVCEPTRCQAVLGHRGIATWEVTFSGEAGHSSAGSQNSAVHAACRWGSQALDLCSAPPFDDLRFNLGRIEGGSKPNVTASAAQVLVGIRPKSDFPLAAFQEALQALCPGATWNQRFLAPGLAPSDGAASLADSLGLPVGAPVDFWTEAALFAETGLPAVVFGPGSIAQAHAAEEYVELAQLERAVQVFRRLFGEAA